MRQGQYYFKLKFANYKKVFGKPLEEMYDDGTLTVTASLENAELSYC